MIYRILRVVVFVFLALQCLAAQSQSWNDYYETGSEALERGDYYSANYYLEKCMELDSTVFDLNVKYAESLRLTKRYALAKLQYEKVFKKDKGKIYSLGQFKLAEMQYMTGEYKQAIRNFKKFKRKKKKDVDDSFYALAEQWVKTSTYALTTENALLESKIKDMPELINDSELQISPVKMDSSLYFASYAENKNVLELKEVIISQNEAGAKSSLVVLGLEKELDLANLTFGSGNQVFFSACSGDTCMIYSGEIENQVISNIATLNLGLQNVSMPSYLERNGKAYLFLVSNDSGGEGSRDIYVSERNGQQWTNALNLGPKINTPGDELSPFYDGKNLFFSSNWHNGFGGYDIVFSEGWLAQWKEVKNPGEPLNSSYHDLYYTYNSEQEQGWFSSNRPSDKNLVNSTCCSKIYAFEYPDSLETNERSYKDLAELNKYLPVTLYFHNDEPNPRTRLTETEFNYLTTYNEYLDLIPRYIKENSKGTRGEAKLDAELDVEEFFELFVEKGVSDLEVFSELLLKELSSGKSVELEVKGYASPRAKSDYNENLSRRRIHSLVNYLTEYQGGVFKPYLNSKAFNKAELTVVENPFGEEAAASNVSDALEDEKESIYSRGARLERKIEIRSVTFLEPEIRSNEAVLELGDVKKNEVVTTSYTLTNPSDQTIYLDSIISSCGCTVPKLEKDFIPAGEDLVIELEFDTTDKDGYQQKSVVIYSAQFTEPKILTIRSFVNP
ncbi:MAG: DUF1573 domain-containing protein [Flavobacteriales bacterium]